MTDKSLWSRVYQVAVVVRDMDDAIEYYSSLGIGPFRPLNKRFNLLERKVYGRAATDITNLVMVTQMGPIEFELFQPITGASVQREFLETRGEGVHHLAFRVDNLDKEIATLVQEGFKVIDEGKFVDGGGWAYVDTQKVGGVVFELTQLPTQ